MKLNRLCCGGTVTSILFFIGCAGFVLPTADEILVSSVSAKADELVASVGGEDGYGGMMMGGYADHVSSGMGFWQTDDLAPDGSMVTVQFHNDSGEDCTFDFSYIAARTGLDEQSILVDVDAGDSVAFDIECAEMMGLGELGTPGAVGCMLANGDEIENTMAVPGFLNLDYLCGETYSHHLRTDVDDLDEDGDTEELVVYSDALLMHLEDGGPTGHQHGFGMGMMGGHRR